MFIIDQYTTPYAGTEGQLMLLIRDLDRELFEPELTLFRKSEYINNNNFPCPVHSLGIEKLFSFKTVVIMLRFSASLKKRGIKLAHIFFNDASIVAPLFLKIRGIKVIISRRDMGYWYTPFTMFILKVNRFFVDRAIVNSEAVKSVTHNAEGVPNSKIDVIYNGHKFSEAVSSEAGIEAESFGIARSSRIIGIVANIRPIKRIDELIRAFAMIAADIPDTEVLVVGGGDTGELEVLAKELGVSGKVHFSGQQSDVQSIIKLFTVAVSCSESEGFSNSIVEYMRGMVPVVCNNVGGNSEIVIDGETGYIVPPNNTQALAERINDVLSNPVRAQLLAENAYQHIVKLCDQKTMIDKHSKIYQSLTNQLD